MKTFLRILLATTLAGAATAFYAAELPKAAVKNGASQLVVNGKPFLILGGELANSSAGTAAQADAILPRLARMHVNTVLLPVAWEQLEPTEGAYDFSILDHWIDVARTENMHLVPLWFGAWKNAFSNYTPAWVKADTKRFPRAASADGLPLEILSTLSAETLKCDSRAFANLLHHIKQKDEKQQTVLMVQVENEVGYLGRGRDRSVEANRLFQAAVPTPLLRDLQAERGALSPELAAHFHPENNAGNPHGRTWQEVFGEAADEVFMAWHYATYIQGVAEAGKREYALPMYVNAQLPAPAERAGEYPSGGPHPYYLQVYRSAAPALDFFSPDIYWPNFEYWVDRYRLPGNAIFIPEARIESSPYNAFYAYGAAKAFGFAAFGIDSLKPAEGEDVPLMQQTYEALDSLRDMIVDAQPKDHTRGLVLHATSPRPTQTVALGGFLFQATLARSWPTQSLLTDNGAMILIQSAPDEFYIAGSGLTVTFFRDPDVDQHIAGIGSIEEVSRKRDTWTTERRLNGDQSNQGRQLSMAPHQVRIYRIKLYSITKQSLR